jgi:hypothetical protein
LRTRPFHRICTSAEGELGFAGEVAHAALDGLVAWMKDGLR